MLVGVLMYVHSARRFLAVAGCHAVELPAVVLIKAVVVCQKIQHRLAECRHVITYALQQPPCDAFAAVLRLDIYGTDIRPQVRSVVKIVLYNSQPADYLAVAAEHHIPAWDSARREAVIHALKICRQRHAPFLVEPLRRRLNKLRTVTQAYKFILHR